MSAYDSAETIANNALEQYLQEQVTRALQVGVPRTFSDTEKMSAAIPCNQYHCRWMLAVEWRDGMHTASLGYLRTEVLLRDHFEREHGIPVLPAPATWMEAL